MKEWFSGPVLGRCFLSFLKERSNKLYIWSLELRKIFETMWENRGAGGHGVGVAIHLSIASGILNRI